MLVKAYITVLKSRAPPFLVEDWLERHNSPRIQAIPAHTGGDIMSRIGASSLVLLALTAAQPQTPRAYAQQASRTVDVTDGAADPAVSPDGAQIALSILGKIWIVPAAGGDAR